VLLAKADPHVALRKAWNETIRCIRMAKNSGTKTVLHHRSEVERLLDMEATGAMDLIAFKTALKRILDTQEQDAKIRTAVEIDQMASQWLPQRLDGNVSVMVENWPSALSVQSVDRVTGLPGGTAELGAQDAAAFVHHFQNMNIGGSRLNVHVALPPNTTLPSIRRSDRGRKRQRGKKPWLPFLDDIGRLSATPERIAKHHGTLLAQPQLPVIDPFCGAGGDAIGAALAGCSVLASDRDPSRIELAKQNAEHFGVQDHIQFAVQEAEIAVSPETWAESCLFLDPPWGGEHWNREEMGLDVWAKQWPWLPACLRNARSVVLKLPRTFDLQTLESTERHWTIEAGIENDADHPADRLRLLTAYSL